MFFTQISQIARIRPHGCARGFLWHTDSTDSTDCGGLTRTDSPCPAGRDLVDLVDYFLRDSVRVRGLESCRFLFGIAGCARWMGLSLTRVFLFACSLRSRNLVDLINLFLRDSVRVRGWFKSCRFLYGIAGCARWIGLSLARGVTQISQIPQIISHCCARGGVCHTESTENTEIIALLRSRFFSHRYHRYHRFFRVAALARGVRLINN